MAAFARVGLPLFVAALLLLGAAAGKPEEEVEAETRHASAPPSPLPAVNLTDVSEEDFMLAPVVIYNFHEEPLMFDIGAQASSEKLFVEKLQLLPFRDGDHTGVFNSGSRFVINAVLPISGSPASSFRAQEDESFELTTGYVSVATVASRAGDVPQPTVPPTPAPESDVSAEGDVHAHRMSSTKVGDIDPKKGSAFFGVVILGSSSMLYDVHGYLCDDNMAFSWRTFKDKDCPKISAGSGHMWGDCWAMAFCSVVTLRDGGYDSCFDVPQAKLAHLAWP